MIVFNHYRVGVKDCSGMMIYSIACKVLKHDVDVTILLTINTEMNG